MCLLQHMTLSKPLHEKNASSFKFQFLQTHHYWIILINDCLIELLFLPVQSHADYDIYRPVFLICYKNFDVLSRQKKSSLRDFMFS